MGFEFLFTEVKFYQIKNALASGTFLPLLLKLARDEGFEPPNA
jgi:hypothetical protein